MAGSIHTFFYTSPQNGIRKLIRSLFYTLVLSVCLFQVHVSHAQVSQYVFSGSNGTYIPGLPALPSTPASVFPVSWDDQTTTFNFPFNFYYNGNVYTTSGSIGVHSDGWIAFSAGSISMTGTGAGGTWVSKLNPAGVYLNGNANNQGVAVFNADLQEQAFSSFTGSLTAGSQVISSVSSFIDIQVGTRLSASGISDGTVVSSFDAMAGTITMSADAISSGSVLITPRSSIYAFVRGIAPNRQMVIQWTQVYRYNAGVAESINVQAVLNEAGGISSNQGIDIIFGDCSSADPNPLNVQLGLRGSSSADFHARSSSSGWGTTSLAATNTESVAFSQTSLPASGQTFSWVPCVSVPSAAGTLFGASTVCTGAVNQPYSLAAVSGATFYTWSYSGTGASFTPVTTTPSNSISFSVGATAGTLTVIPGNICGNAVSTSLGITFQALPVAGISYPLSILCTSSPGQTPVTISGTTGGTFTAAPAGLVIDAATGAITSSSSTPGTYTVTYSFSNGTCSNTTSTLVSVTLPLSGDYTVGSGGNFATLTAAANAYNNSCLNGSVNFILTDATYTASETFPLIFGKNSYASSVQTLSIRPATGIDAQISGSVNNNALIRITGDHIHIEGSNNGTQSRNLTIINNAGVQPRVVLFGSTGTSAVTNASVRNTVLRNGTTDAAVVVCSDATSIASPGYFSDITIENNVLQNALYGIYCNAVYAGSNGNGLSILSNDLSSSGSMAIQFTGIFVQGVNGISIRKNNISNFRGTDNASDNGIWIAANVTNAEISGNTITNLNYTGTAGHGARGIFINSGVANANILISNNMIANLSGDGFNFNSASLGLNNPTGILLSSGTPQSGIRISNNSISLGTVAGFTNTLNQSSALSACIRMRSGTTVDIQNNILVNRLGRAGSLGLGSIGIMATSSLAQLALLDNNIYFISGTGGGSNPFGMIGGTQYGSWLGWRTATGKDLSSLNVLPVFVSGNDLHLDPAANAAIHNKGKFLSEISLDIDDKARNEQMPDIGCDEFVPANSAFWIGKQSVTWTDPENWEDHIVPNVNTDVTITGGYNFLPTITGNQSVRGLNLLGLATDPVLTVSSGASLEIAGAMSYTGAAKIDAQFASIHMNGSVAQTIPAGIFQNNQLLNLIVGNSSVDGLTLGGTLDIYRSLTFSATGNKFNTGGFITLKSTAAETAWLGDVTGKTIVGQATVERYVPTGISHGKSWQLLSVPLSGSQTINQAWQESNLPLGNSQPGFGTIITGNVANATSLGFDIATPVASGPSMKTYNPATNGWTGIANTNATPIENKKGYLVFVRGDRSVTTSTAPATPTVLRAKGHFFTASAGELPPSTTVLADQFESVGNPYASAIDFTQISKPGPAFIDNTFYVWDPLLPGSQNLGGYQTISSINGFKPIPGGTANYHEDSVITTIQSGQAFFVHATGPASGGIMSFTESAKKSGSRVVLREQQAFQARESGMLRVELLSGTNIADASLVSFSEDHSNAYTNEDALKLFNGGENLGIRLAGRVVSLEARKQVQNNDTIFYQVNNLRRQPYRFIIKPSGLSSGLYSAFMHDRYLNTMYPVSLNENTQLDFIVTSDALSAASDRFFLVFRQNLVLPVTFIKVSAARNREKSATVKWTVEEEARISDYSIERSTDGARFLSVGSVSATGNTGTLEYKWLDLTAPQSDCFYRIRANGRDGDKLYSAIVKLVSDDSRETFSVYPNPVADRTMNIHFSNATEGSYTIRLYNTSGHLALTKQVSYVSGTVMAIPLPAGLSAGAYQVVITGRAAELTSLGIVIQ